VTVPARSRSLLSLLALLTAIIAIGVVASASTVVAAETRVRANAHSITTRVGTEHRVLAGRVGRATRVYDLFVSATGVAFRLSDNAPRVGSIGTPGRPKGLPKGETYDGIAWRSTKRQHAATAWDVSPGNIGANH